MFEDTEAEIRNICCLRLEVIAEIFGKQEIFDQVLQQLKKIEKDQISYVRGALASTMLRICPLIGKSKTSDFIFPVFLNLIKDRSTSDKLMILFCSIRSFCFFNFAFLAALSATICLTSFY